MQISYLLKHILFWSLLSLALSLGAQVNAPNYPEEGLLREDQKGFLDPGVDYQKLVARVTDRDKSGHTFKLKSENKNSKFLRSGDRLAFTIGDKGKRFCYGTVKDVEDQHFILHVSDLDLCYDSHLYFKRGTTLYFKSKVLEERVSSAAKFRRELILKRSDFLKQLSQINHYLWTYDQKKMQLAAEYDAQIVELQRQKRKALDDLVTRKKDNMQLQVRLKREMDEIDNSLEFYQIDRQEIFSDRWYSEVSDNPSLGPMPQQLKADEDYKSELKPR